VCFGKRVVERDSLERRRPGLREEGDAARRIERRQNPVRIGKAAIGECVTRIVRDRLLEVNNAFPDRLFRSLVPEVTAPQVNLVSLRVVRVALR
jgi:hypothetical protein